MAYDAIDVQPKQCRAMPSLREALLVAVRGTQELLDFPFRIPHSAFRTPHSACRIWY
jgi:hypothetical protein